MRHNLFHSARLKLTLWYLLIIALISVLFSVAFYSVSTNELSRVIRRMESRQLNPDRLPMPDRVLFQTQPTPPSLEDLETAKDKLKMNLIIINGIILIIAGGASYFLAGRTLKPIKTMIDEQNQFISSSSHELRTPIATLRAELEGALLEKQLTDKMARKLIKSNLEELDTLQELTNKLLKLAKVHNIGVSQSMSKVSISEVLEIAQKKAAILAKQKNITLSSAIKTANVQGDKASLIELFVILIDNAIKYSQKGSKISILAKSHKDHISIFVKDNGIGILEDDLPLIFDRFYRADKSRSEEGYGLGLSIAKQIVEIHNGTIRVESKSKKPTGTTFIITLPILR